MLGQPKNISNVFLEQRKRFKKVWSQENIMNDFLLFQEGFF